MKELFGHYSRRKIIAVALIKFCPFIIFRGGVDGFLDMIFIEYETDLCYTNEI